MSSHAAAPANAGSHPYAIVVLGCTLRWDQAGELVGAAARRVEMAAAAANADDAALVVATGGRVWQGVVEADAMRDALARLGVPPGRVLRERCSYSTRDNARFTAALLARAGVPRASLVTCDWHQARALALFRAQGLDAKAIPVPSPAARWTVRLWRWGRERVAARLDGVEVSAG
jgi:uncharacterized SAM-binding protein YcdF (DUF218 family)